jgi:hypothetical protein
MAALRNAPALLRRVGKSIALQDDNFPIIVSQHSRRE